MSPLRITSPAVAVAAHLRHPPYLSDRGWLYAYSQHLLDPHCLPITLAAEFAAAGSMDHVSMVAGLVIDPRCANMFGGPS